MEPTRRKTASRCLWARNGSPLYIAYHDEEWGVPQHDDAVLFEFLTLEGAQAGLSWSTILNKRENYRSAFSGFDVRRIAKYDSAKIDKLMLDTGIVRNRLKIEAAVANARAFIEVQMEFGSFDAYIWRIIGGRSRHNGWTSHNAVPTSTVESDAMSKDLKYRGFKFVGSTIMYAFMQATGLVNDHTTDCYRWKQLKGREKART